LGARERVCFGSYRSGEKRRKKRQYRGKGRKRANGLKQKVQARANGRNRSGRHSRGILNHRGAGKIGL